MLCKHQERIENKEIFPSAWQQMTEAERERTQPAPWMFKCKVAITFICTVCGRRKTITEESATSLI